MRRSLMVLAALSLFSAGFVAGSTYTRNSIALELGGLNGTIESLKSLGGAIVEMQKNVDELQQNIEEVKKVKDDIAGYQGVYDSLTGQKKPAGGQTLTDDAKKGLTNMLNQPKK